MNHNRARLLGTVLATAAAVAVAGACGTTAERTAGTTASASSAPSTAPGTEPSSVTSPPPASVTTNPRPVQSEVPVTDSTPIETALQPMVDVAVADLAARLGVDPTEITTVSAQFVVWPDGGLGCPRPGMNYIQVQVDGALIELAAGGTTYRYHAGDSGAPFLCEQSFRVQPLPPGDLPWPTTSQP